MRTSKKSDFDDGSNGYREPDSRLVGDRRPYRAELVLDVSGKPPRATFTLDGRIELARLADGQLAPFHLISSLPREWAARCDAAGNDMDAQLDLERDLQREAGLSEDYREGVAAFLAKRPPVFKGR